MAKKRKHKLFSNWKHIYRITIFNDYTFKEVWKIRATKRDIFTIVAAFNLVMFILMLVIIAFTPIRELIPGYPDGKERRQIVMNAILVDSIKKELEVRDRYFENLKRVIYGEPPVDEIDEKDTLSSTGMKKITFTKSQEDSLLRKEIEKEEQFDLSLTDRTIKEDDISNLFFFPPLKGVISSSFDPVKNHYATDIAANEGSVVHATTEGTVLMASWTIETGYVIEIQHHNNLVSVYKHNKKLLKDVGDHVRTGESIAIIGNSGELYTSGPHLHFELWFKGKPLNSEKFIIY
jgi:murein DD-endopeptidase MepM/ murein hydrolase activator NlpD